MIAPRANARTRPEPAETGLTRHRPRSLSRSSRRWRPEPRRQKLNRARFYQPSIGRFSQEDPATFGASSWQQYTYVHSSPLSLSDPHGEVPQAAAGAAVSGAIAAGSSILTGYLLEQILGDGCYTVDDALVDGLTGVIGYGVLSKVNKAWRLYKLRRIARAEGMVNKGLKGYVETWVHPSDALKKLDIKLAPAVSPNVQAGSKVPRFSFRIDAGVFRDPFTGAVGPKGALSHVPLEPPLSPGAAAAAGGVGSLLGPTSKADCGCLLSWR